jgi:hypothetical protein
MSVNDYIFVPEFHMFSKTAEAADFIVSILHSSLLMQEKAAGIITPAAKYRSR